MRKKVVRCYTFDAYVVYVLEQLPKGKRSKAVNDWMRQCPDFIAFMERKQQNERKNTD